MSCGSLSLYELISAFCRYIISVSIERTIQMTDDAIFWVHLVLFRENTSIIAVNSLKYEILGLSRESVQ